MEVHNPSTYDMDGHNDLYDVPEVTFSQSKRTTFTNSGEPALVTDDDAFLRAGGRVEANTPDTFVGVIAPEPRPDITLWCEQCKTFVALKFLKEHRNFHQALLTMKYKDGSPPYTVEALMKRRRGLLKRMRNDNNGAVDTLEISRLNDAFELLKADVQDTFDLYRRVDERVNTDVQSIALNCSTTSASAVGFCSHGNDRWKSHMEDTRVFQDFFGNDMHKCFFGIYDGHHGRFAAEIAANELHHALLMEMDRFDPHTKCTCAFNMANSYDVSEYEIEEIHSRPTSKYSDRKALHNESTNLIQQIIRNCEDQLISVDKNQSNENEKEGKDRTPKKEKKKHEKDPFAQKMADAFTKAYKYTDSVLAYGRDESSRVRWSGTSALTCVIQDNTAECKTKTSPAGSQDKKNEKLTHSQNSDEVFKDEDDSGDGPMKVQIELEELGTIHVANAGNTHAVLVRGNHAYCLSRDHTPHNPREKSRILREGGTINESERELMVNSVLTTTRGLGNHGDPALKKCVVCEPYTTSVKIDQFAQYLLLASSGVWQVFSTHEATTLVSQMLPSNHVPPPSSLGSSLNFIFAGPPSQLSMRDRQSNASYNDDENRTRQTIRGNRIQSTGILKGEMTGGKARGNVTINEASPPSVPSQPEHSQESTAANLQHTPSSPTSQSPSNKSNKDPHNNASPKTHLDVADDMRTEVGSRAVTDDLEGDPAGDDSIVGPDYGDVELLGMPDQDSEPHVPTRQEIQRDLAKSMAQRLVQSALLAGARDNITVMVILLPGCGV